MSTNEQKLEYAIAVGDGEFPFSMLRHEQAFPNCDHSADFMSGDEDEGKRMVVLARHRQPGKHVTALIWKSYGWTLDVGGDGQWFRTMEDAKAKMAELWKGCKEA